MCTQTFAREGHHDKLKIGLFVLYGKKSGKDMDILQEELYTNINKGYREYLR